MLCVVTFPNKHTNAASYNVTSSAVGPNCLETYADQFGREHHDHERAGPRLILNAATIRHFHLARQVRRGPLANDADALHRLQRCSRLVLATATLRTSLLFGCFAASASSRSSKLQWHLIICMLHAADAHQLVDRANRPMISKTTQHWPAL